MGSTSLSTYCRMAGSSVCLVAHLGNSLAMFLALRGDILEDPDIKKLHSQQFAFFTIWNVAFQIMYSCMSLACDFRTILNVKGLDILNHLPAFRDFFFDTFVWPCTLCVFIVFWPIFLYDREVIFPAYIDKAFTPTSNYIMHFFILPIVLWDIVFQERSDRTLKKGHWGHKIQLIFIYVCYLTTVIGNYYRNGLWPYPFVYKIFGTIYFPLVCIGAGATLWSLFYVQWPLRRLITCNSKSKKH